MKLKQMTDPAPVPEVIALMMVAISIGLVVAWAIVKGPLNAF